LRACRSSTDSPPTLTCPSLLSRATFFSRSVSTATLRTMVAPGGGPDPPAVPPMVLGGSTAGCAEGGVTSRTRNATLPKVTTSPTPATISVTRAPFTNVPLLEPRSLTCTPPLASATSAWRREMVGS